MSNQPYQWQPQPEPPKNPRRAYPGWVTVLILAAGGLVAVIAVSFVMTNVAKNDPPPSTPAGDTYSAIAAQIDCEAAVKPRLVSPATAEFEYTVQKPSGAGWELRGYVDSENALGATVRSVFGCIAAPSGARVTELIES